MPETEVAVVGAGPAGIAAALAAERAGARVALLDESPLPGGQYYRQPLHRPQKHAWRPVPRPLADLARSRLALTSRTLVYGVEGAHSLHWYRDDGTAGVLRAEAVVVATGGYDRPIAFPGWTLPGVFTAGGLQALLKGQGVLPGRRVLLAGTGPFLMPVAVALLEAGATVVAVVEATSRLEWVGCVPSLRRYTARLREAMAYQRRLSRAGIPYYFGHLLTEASGAGSVERVILAETDRQQRPKAGRRQTVEVDCVGIGYGFVASLELPRLLGCELRYDATQDQYLPWHSPDMQTSVPAVFVAGETSGIGGAELALVTGTIAGLSAARAAGRQLNAECQEELDLALARREQLQPFADALNRLFAVRSGVYELARDETILCRCEEVTFGEARRAIRHGITTANGLKSRVRVGMGPCQGRMCGSLVAHLVSAEADVPVPDAGLFTSRPPIKPIPLGALLSVRDPAPVSL